MAQALSVCVRRQIPIFTGEKMKKFLTCILLVVSAFGAAYSQKKIVGSTDLVAARREAIREVRESKWDAAKQIKSDEAVPGYYDNDSFGRNAKFLGAFYAGTLYVYHSCDPQILLDELGLTLAADDKCVAHSVAAPMPTTDVADATWRIVIPAGTVNNVIYPVMNHSIGFDSFSSTGSMTGFFYSPRVTIESSALSDPAAIDPNTGLPMNGSFTTSLAGAKQRQRFMDNGDVEFNYDSAASVSSRGFSRDYFADLGLPQHVIDNLFARRITLKFRIRARFSGAIDFGQAFYTYRLFGN
jgi:hypothetical protein